MTAMPSGDIDTGGDRGHSSSVGEHLEYALTGHSGESDRIMFVPFGGYQKVKNEKKRLQIMQEMIAHTQFTISGDNTLEAASRAIRDLKSDDDANRSDSGSREVQYQR